MPQKIPEITQRRWRAGVTLDGILMHDRPREKHDKRIQIALPTRSRECSLNLSHSKMQIHAEELNYFVHAAEREGIRFGSN